VGQNYIAIKKPLISWFTMPRGSCRDSKLGGQWLYVYL
jgi:hypothetical protein